MIRALAISALVLASAHAYASPSCDKAVTTLDINECAKKDLDQAEEGLNKTYRSVLVRLAKDGKDDPDAAQARQALISTQRSWITFREADCKAIYTLWQSGTMRTLMYLSCMKNHAEQRTKELGDYVRP